MGAPPTRQLYVVKRIAKALLSPLDNSGGVRWLLVGSRTPEEDSVQLHGSASNFSRTSFNLFKILKRYSTEANKCIAAISSKVEIIDLLKTVSTDLRRKLWQMERKNDPQEFYHGHWRTDDLSW